MFDKLSKIWSMLEGHKSYVMIVGVVVTETLYTIGYITPETRSELLKVFSVGFAATFSSKINRFVNILKKIHDFTSKKDGKSYTIDLSSQSDKID